MGLCRDCKFWTGIKVVEHGQDEYGYKTIEPDISHNCSCPKIIVEEPENFINDGLVYIDGEAFDVSLIVGPDFGCIHFQDKPEVK